jgi:HAD superfamily hydrolase (TIGR01450 family)
MPGSGLAAAAGRPARPGPGRGRPREVYAIIQPMPAYDAYVFDLDGTVYLGDALLPNAGTTIRTVRERGRRTVFLSNNPTHSAAEYAAKLTRLGLPTPVGDVVNSSLVMADFLARLRETDGINRLFVVGEPPLCEVLAGAGFELVDDARATQAVIASFDRTFVYRKLQIAFDAIRAGARFFATNGDRYCPVPGGGEPDAASIIAAIEACTNTRCEAIVGKPSRHMTNAILHLVGVPAERCLIIGDRLETDVQMGLDAGMGAALMLTGATTLAHAEASPIKPTFVFRDLGDILERAL